MDLEFTRKCFNCVGAVFHVNRMRKKIRQMAWNIERDEKSCNKAGFTPTLFLFETRLFVGSW